MPDPRFYEALGPVSVAELAALAGASLSPSEEAGRPIAGAAPLGRAGAGEVAFLSAARYRHELADCAAGAVFVRASEAPLVPEAAVALVATDPQAAYCRAAERLHRLRIHPAGPAVHPSAEIEADVVLGPGVVVGPGARIGTGTSIGPNSVVGPGVAIGRGCVIGANVSIGFALIGDRVRIYAGAVIGEAGFGVAGHGSNLVDVPQLGRVILQDGVTVGAGSCIDRGAWDDTVVGENTKIDNLVQIAHNVRIGRNCVLAAQTGISGSVVIGDGVMFGGSAGIADHLKVGDGARIAAAAGVMKDVAAGEAVGGAPARPLRQFMRETAWLARESLGRKETTSK